MPHLLRGVCVIVFLLLSTVRILAQEAPSEEAIRAAVARSLPLLEASARRSMEKRPGCFTCHNQCLPIMAITAARQRGLAVDEQNLAAQLDFTAAFLARNRDNYLVGKGQGGQALTAGYAMLALELGGRKRDETSDAVVEYVLRYQMDRDHWKPQTRRPPTEESPFTTTYLALRALQSFGAESQRERIDERRAKVSQWLATTPAASTEDRVFRLFAMKFADVDADIRLGALGDLRRAQREDGSWLQLAEMPPDAYATATALVALHQAGGVPTSDPAWQRGLAWLLRTQLPDGSWHVKTRSEPIQTYYESGYPHGEDQFISISAAGWATTALALSLPDPARP